MRLARLAASGLIMLLLLAGCQPVKANLPKGGPVAPPAPAKPVEAVVTVESTATDKTDWKAEARHLRDDRAALETALKTKDAQIESADKRAKEQEVEKARDKEKALHDKEAAYGRYIAYICFALSTILTIVSFIPVWGSLVPKWAGPLGMCAGVFILVAVNVWVWAADHIMQLSIGAGVIGVLVIALILKKGGTLLWIRHWFSNSMEKATTEAERLHIKADSLEHELQAGVHALGQKLRNKPLKSMKDVIKMRVAAHALEKDKA